MNCNVRVHRNSAGPKLCMLKQMCVYVCIRSAIFDFRARKAKLAFCVWVCSLSSFDFVGKQRRCVSVYSHTSIFQQYCVYTAPVNTHEKRNETENAENYIVQSWKGIEGTSESDSERERECEKKRKKRKEKREEWNTTQSESYTQPSNIYRIAVLYKSRQTTDSIKF